MATILTALFEAWVGGFFLYHALNAIYGWKALPEASPAFAKFIQGLYAQGPLMSLVKALELVAAGLLLLSLVHHLAHFLGADWGLIDLSPYALILLAPIVLVIVCAHLTLNFRRGYGIAMWTLLPYLALCLLRLRSGS